MHNRSNILLASKYQHDHGKKVSVGLYSHSNRDCLIIVYSHSNYPDLYQIPNQTREAIITAMRHSIGRFGVAEEVFSDNEPCFASAEYILTRTTSSLLYPQSNGLVEKTIKL